MESALITIKVDIETEVESAAQLCEAHAANWKMMATTNKHRQPGMKAHVSRDYCLRNHRLMMGAAQALRQRISSHINDALALALRKPD